MGLDMYMYKIKPVTTEEANLLVGFHVDDIRQNYDIIYKSDVECTPEAYLDILPYAQEVVAIARVFDENKFRKDYGIENGDIPVGQGIFGNSITWIFASGKRVEMSQAEYELYSPEQDISIFVYSKEDLAYWRNDDDLHDFIGMVRCAVKAKDYIHENNERPNEETLMSWRIHNCGLHLLTQPEKDAVVRYMEQYNESQPAKYKIRLMPALLNQDAVVGYRAWW